MKFNQLFFVSLILGASVSYAQPSRVAIEQTALPAKEPCCIKKIETSKGVQCQYKMPECNPAFPQGLVTRGKCAELSANASPQACWQ